MKIIIVTQAIAIIILLLIEPTSTAITLMILFKNQNKEISTESDFNIEISNNKIYNKRKILDDIDNIKNKTIVINKTIGFIIVRYWEHIIQEKFYVINDSILLHIDPITNEILFYKKSWTDIKINLSIFDKQFFNPINHSWMRYIIFPDERDCKNIYRFNQNQSYPIIGLEIRYINGNTKIYNQLGDQIGIAVPAPSFESFSISGYDQGNQHDPWRIWRENANKWFNKWFDKTITISTPSNEQVSAYINDPKVLFFYEIAHSGGLPNRFQTNGDKIYYTANQLREDMMYRGPMKLAILCSCEAMKRVDEGTLSHEFRKGEFNDTITIGYKDMGNSTGWYYSLDWQNAMFIYIDRGHTIKNAFLLASSIYPQIVDNVVFVGDEKMRLKDIINNCILDNRYINTKLKIKISHNFKQLIMLQMEKKEKKDIIVFFSKFKAIQVRLDFHLLHRVLVLAHFLTHMVRLIHYHLNLHLQSLALAQVLLLQSKLQQ
jgi:hypothetical protein